MPTLKPVTASPGSDWAQFAATFSHTNERASAGYYRVRLDDGIETELTATPRTGLARFSFPPASSATLLVRTDGAVAINGNEVSGFHSNVISGKKRSFKLYFAAVFDRPFQDIRTWQGTTLGNEWTASGTSSGAEGSCEIATASEKASLSRFDRIVVPHGLDALEITGQNGVVLLECLPPGTPTY